MGQEVVLPYLEAAYGALGTEFEKDGLAARANAVLALQSKAVWTRWDHFVHCPLWFYFRGIDQYQPLVHYQNLDVGEEAAVFAGVAVPFGIEGHWWLRAGVAKGFSQ